MNDNYYCYVLLDPRFKGDYKFDSFTFAYRPFYVGKGKERRRFIHIWAAKNDHDLRNPHKERTIKSILKDGHEPIIQIAFDDLSDSEALEKERSLIQSIGRRRYEIGQGNQGLLTNLTDGGDFNPMADATIREKVRLHHVGKKRSDETRRKIREAALGRVPSEARKQGYKKSSETLKGNCYAGKRVECRNIETEEVKVFPSVLQASAALGIRWETIDRFIHKGNKQGHVKKWHFHYV